MQNESVWRVTLGSRIINPTLRSCDVALGKTREGTHPPGRGAGTGVRWADAVPDGGRGSDALWPRSSRSDARGRGSRGTQPGRQPAAPRSRAICLLQSLARDDPLHCSLYLTNKITNRISYHRLFFFFQ